MEDSILGNPRPVDPSGFMAALKGAARAEEVLHHKQKEIAIPLEQPSQKGDYIPDPVVMAIIK